MQYPVARKPNRFVSSGVVLFADARLSPNSPSREADGIGYEFRCVQISTILSHARVKFRIIAFSPRKGVESEAGKSACSARGGVLAVPVLGGLWLLSPGGK